MTQGHLIFRWLGALLLAAASLAAHGHGDEPHGDDPHPATTAATGPRFEAATESFELVGRLEGGALTLLINRFETSEPVSQAQVELESGDLKAVARYDAAQGSYVVQDRKFVQALSRPGEHALVVSVLAGQEADLLEATLYMLEPAAPAQAQASRWTAWIASVAAVLMAVFLASWLLRKRRMNTIGGRS